MSPWVALLLPPAVAFVGLRLIRLLLGREFTAQYGIGLRFAVGLGTGMLVFTQALLFGTLVGVPLAGLLAGLALLWGLGEFALGAWQGFKNAKRPDFRRHHFLLLLLVPLLYYFWIWFRLSVVEGTLEFDAVSFWVFKSKILYLKHGPAFLEVIRDPNLFYTHWDYPLLVPGLYALNYGACGGVNEYVSKVWPVWMVAALGLALLSLGDSWRRPRLLPIALVLIVCFLPATLFYIHLEGATIPMVFYASLAALLAVQTLARNDPSTFAASLVILAGCAMTKFEGLIYAGLWLGLLLPVAWRRGWLRWPPLWKAATLGAICLLPYLALRLNHPVTHPESAWPTAAIHSPARVLQNFPKILGIGLARRFVDRDFAHWTETGAGGLQWSGQATLWTIPINYHLGVLPWLALFLVGVALRRPRHRQTSLLLTGAVFGVLTTLALVIACLPPLFDQGTDATFILNKTGEDMGRYYYPFFMAWFLGVASLFYREDQTLVATPG